LEQVHFDRLLKVRVVVRSYYLIISLALIFLTLNASGQENGKKLPEQPHEVSGVILDSIGTALAGANVLLKSSSDSVRMKTNDDGVFVFEEIRSSIFTIQASYTGYKAGIFKYFFNPDTHIIVLNPILLSQQAVELKDVTINGTPSIKYKKDTVEYRASDYKVKPFDNVSELLKQMEGMEVGANGKLFYHGEAVKTAKLNGKEFAGGDVRNVLENLPAEIVEKIQIVDDYGELAAKTGIKENASNKILNVTTQADKSIANIGLLKTQSGTQGRLNEQASFENINGNRVLAVNGNFKKTVAGIGATDVLATESGTPDYVDISRPGKTTVSSPSVSYTNDSGKGISFVGSYNFGYERNLLNQETTSQVYSTSGSTLSTAGSIADENNKLHQVHAKLNYEVSKYNFVQVLAEFLHSDYGQSLKTQGDYLNNFVSGRQHFSNMIQDLTQDSKNDYKISGLYIRSFPKPRRFFSIQLNINPMTQHVRDDKTTNYHYFADSLSGRGFTDSVSHLISNRSVAAKTIQLTLMYAEPVSPKALVEAYSFLRRTDNSTSANTDTIYQDGSNQELLRLRNNFDYNFTESKFSIDYHYLSAKTELVLGAAPYITSIKPQSGFLGYSRNTNSTFSVLPVFSFSVNWSKMERLDLRYNESTKEPTSTQIQPYRDITDPNNIIVGNPAIKATLIHTLSGTYNRYFPNDLVNVSVNTMFRTFQHDITTNLIQNNVTVADGISKTTNDITYLNTEGNQNVETKLSVSKQLRSSQIKLEFDGAVSYFYRHAFSNSIEYNSTQWHFSNKFGPRFNFGEIAGINPYIEYSVDRSFTNTQNAFVSTTHDFMAAVSGYCGLPLGLELHSSAVKNYLRGFGQYNTNPFVVNAGLQQRILKRKNLMLTFDVFDLFNQNNFIQQTLTPQSTVYTKSNTSSRYLLFGLQYNFERWGGTPTRNGEKFKRRGDGSFIK
jgi:outer membrane lipopolysaccharide assembly protein LptE/RlpB